MEETNNEVKNSLEFNLDSLKHLEEARKWAMFLAILGFIGVGIMVLVALFSGSAMAFLGDDFVSPALGIGIGILYLLIAVLYFFPVYYLFNFSGKAKKAVKESDSKSLTESMKFLKSHYKFLGIMAIVMLVLYPILIAILVLGGIMSSM